MKFSKEEQELIEKVKALFKDKPAHFRVMFQAEVMSEYCSDCGGSDTPCYCRRDE